MSTRRLLIDNDAFVLLAGAGLLEDAIARAGFLVKESRRLASLEFMLRKPAKAFQKYPAEVISRALEACARVPKLEEAPTAAALESFARVVGVNDGEAVFLGLMMERQFHFLASNDKTAMKAVATDPKLKDVRKQVAGRIYCMELLLEKLIASKGPEVVAQRFAPLMTMEKRICTILSPANTGRPQDCQDAVKSFLAGLRRDFGDDFLCQ
jgi:hypothetical protein